MVTGKPVVSPMPDLAVWSCTWLCRSGGVCGARSSICSRMHLVLSGRPRAHALRRWRRLQPLQQHCRLITRIQTDVTHSTLQPAYAVSVSLHVCLTVLFRCLVVQAWHRRNDSSCYGALEIVGAVTRLLLLWRGNSNLRNAYDMAESCEQSPVMFVCELTVLTAQWVYGFLTINSYILT